MTGASLTSFTEDKLEREGIANYLLEFIKTAQPTVNESSLVLALDSPWGTGKTSFMNMLIDKIGKNNQANQNDVKPIYCIKYNAWENDDFQDALAPLICSILDGAENEAKINQETFQSTGKFLLRMGFSGLRLMSCFATHGIDIPGVIEDEVERFKKGELSSDQIIEEYRLRKDCKVKFKEFLGCILENHSKIFISIDELDRCRPTFAIETLEIVKHFFDMPNVVFVFSLDMEQLQASIKSVYGEIDAVNYLQRFFDYRYSFSKPDLKNYINDLAKEYNNHNLNNGLLEHLCYKYSVSLRTINIISKSYTYFLEMVKSYSNYTSDCYIFSVYLYFICLKYANPIKYYETLNEGISDADFHDKWVHKLFADNGNTLDDDICIYTKEIANTDLGSIYSNYQNNRVFNIVKASFLISDNLISKISPNSNITIIKVHDAIFNMVEYATITPDSLKK